MRWNPLRHWRSILETVVLVLVGAAAIAVLSRTWTAPAVSGPGTGNRGDESPSEVGLPSEPLSLQGAAVLGDAGARVVLVAYSDFQCPFCATFALEILPKLEERYVKTGQLLIAFRHFPIDKAHPFARQAAEAAECAGKEGRFWPMHNLLFQRQKDLNPSVVGELAVGLGLDRSRFERCLGTEMRQKVQDDVANAKGLAIRGTPTIFAGHRDPSGLIRVRARISGARPYERFERVISDLLK